VGNTAEEKMAVMKLSIILSAALLLPPFAYAAELSVQELELMNQKELCAIVEDYNKLEKDVPEKQPGYDQWSPKAKLDVAQHRLSLLMRVYSNAKRVYLVARKKNGSTYPAWVPKEFAQKGELSLAVNCKLAK
jgi:hypothetical protein